MASLSRLFENNRAWAKRMTAEDPRFFDRLSAQQNPEYLWIGCSDSRVPANQVVGLNPGEVFVHRNVANLVVHTDFNCLSVLHYAVEVLRVKHAIVCGHYGCGGVVAALDEQPLGLIDHWLRHIQDLKHRHAPALQSLDREHQVDRLCELNVVEQVSHLCGAMVVQEAWRRGQPLALHGWIYSIKDGIIRDLGVDVANPAQAAELLRGRQVAPAGGGVPPRSATSARTR
jgi:carbonic anhydrase